MANEEQLAILKQGAEVWNQWREENAGTIPDLTNADLNWAELNGAKLSGATLCGAKLNGAELIQAKLTDADLSNVDLTGADLSQAELNRAKLNKANLSRAKLSGAKLLKADLSGADLSEANIGDAYLEEADLTMADVSGANLSWSNLYNGKLSDVILSRADLRGADLSRADLSRAALGEADLSGTFLGSTLFANVDLSRVIGLESVVHLGPSTIGIDTLYRSQGKIPDIFLRGAGVPDEFIDVSAPSDHRQGDPVLLLLYQLFDQGPGIRRAVACGLTKQRRALLVRAGRHLRAGKSCTSRFRRLFGCMISCYWCCRRIVCRASG